MNETGFNKTTEQLENERATKALLTFLRPEFINRVDEIITFSPLGEKIIDNISKMMLGDLADNLKLREIELVYDDEVISHISSNGYDKKFGARSLKRYIQKEIEDYIASEIISNYNSAIAKITLFVSEDKIQIQVN